MNIFDKIEAITFDPNKAQLFGVKSAILWGHSNETNSMFPLVYISKPKNISQEDFDLIIKGIEIKLLKP